MRAGIVAVVLGLVAAGCFGKDDGSASPKEARAVPPLKLGAWTFYGTAQGLSDDVQDVSADEGGNVYVAGGDALYAKPPGDQAFVRLDARNAGITEGCNDFSEFYVETPAKPFYSCRILAVAGGAPGTAIIGFDGFKVEQELGANWTYHTGGADVVAFDPVARTAQRTRHVWFASPPHTICGMPYSRGGPCSATEHYWVLGRRMFTRVRRVVVNHDRSSPMYGDVWVGGQHATLAALLANASARHMFDRTAGWGPEWTDAKDVWEHEHPNLDLPDGTFVNGEGWGISIDPRDGTPWGSNEYRTSYLTGAYGADLSNDDWFLGHKFDVWPDPAPNTPFTPADDAVRSLSHCPDGTLWIGSLTHGLAALSPSGELRQVGLPDPRSGVSAVACDPTDGSIWIGLAEGGVLRLRGGAFEPLDLGGLPAFAHHPVQSIQLDRWSARRTVYLAFPPTTDAEGRVVEGGGVGAYAGP